MKLLSWNCRGLGNPATIRALPKCLERENLDVIFLMETKRSAKEMRILNSSRLRYEGCFFVYCESLPKSRRGGLCMLWHTPVKLELISYSNHHVLFRGREETYDNEWFCTGIYGWHTNQEKEKTWDLLTTVKRDKREEWLCMGDFNEIMWSVEKRGGNSNNWKSMKQFREVLGHCGLMDLGFKGVPYTWSNGRGGSENIRERLDRALANAIWKNSYQHIKVEHLPRYKSDHAPIIIDCEKIADEKGDRSRQFKFRLEHTWIHHRYFQEVVKKSWNDTYMSENLEEKNNNCGVALSRWAAKEFGSTRKKKKELTEQLKEMQQQEEMEGQIDQMRALEQQVDQILKREETMWFRRSQAIWLKDEDKNSSFFHQKASNRKRRNTIKRIVDDSGVARTELKEITEIIRNYYQNIFTSEGPRELSHVLSAIEGKVTVEMNATLDKPYTREEWLTQ